MTKDNSYKHNERLIQDAVVGNYEQLRHKLPYAKAYHDWWLDRMLELATPTNRQGLILDNGCGIGLLTERLGHNSAVTGLDLSLGMLQKAGKTTHNVVQGDSSQLPFQDNQFDLVFARALLHHLPNPEDGIREMYRVLSPGGQVILADTNQSLLSTLPRRIAYKSDNFSENHTNLKHQEYVSWIQQYFTILQLEFFGYLAYPFGFPDMMGKLREIPYPVKLIQFLIHLDRFISRIPLVKTQSWGIIVSAIKQPG